MSSQLPSGWDAFASAKPINHDDQAIDLLDFERVTLMDVRPLPDGSARFLAVGWTVERGFPVEATVGLAELTPMVASLLRRLLQSWPPGEHDFVFQPGWPSVRPCLAGRFLERVAEVDPVWHSQILGEAATLQRESDG